ncbi:RagB/SusD family nutrient uptake outer membrane protein [Paraflavisolibacter sp. H34]|uniref:RagB/SusD family nutrient uptake outer membrane protein n=1 Tax=Huijunlia imazamoxiresistens TaxID=3127457 RepID=UPI003019F18C
MKKFFLICAGLLSLLSLASCSKFLDKEPLSAATDENFWKTESEGNSAVAGGYALLRKALNDGVAFYAYGDFPTDEFLPDLGQWEYGPITRLEWNQSISYAETGRVLMKLRRYDNFYRVIDQANRCIAYLPKIPLEKFTSSNAAAAREKLVGEAYFLRAFSYFYMARVWGGVPLVLQTNTDFANAVHLPRNTEAQVLAQAKSDIAEALKRLQWGVSTTGERAVRANKGAAFALLAHLEAWKGDYAASALAADSVLQKGGYQYVARSSYGTIFKGQSSEGIFEISQNTSNEGVSASGYSIAGLTLRSPYLGIGITVPTLPLDESTLWPKYADSAVDLRVKNGFAFFQSTEPICTKYANIVYTGSNQSGPVAQNNMVVFRLSDLALLKAEALAATGQFGEARNLLNGIRALAQAPAYTGADSGLFEYIIDERGRELFLEGHRFYDLVRLGRAKGILKFGGNRMTSAQFQEQKYYWPLEPYLMTLNPLLTQTDYWKTRM